MSFKLLALRPLDECNEKFLKNLEVNRIYQFYQDYEFLNTNGKKVEGKDKIHTIKFKTSLPDDLFGKGISISAIVGKNGSGKSTIVELLCQFLFSISLKFEYITKESFIKDHSLNDFHEKQFLTELENFDKDFNVSLIYQIDDDIYEINKVGAEFEVNHFEKKEKDSFVLIKKNELSAIKKNRFFYTILENYSLYGLNTNELGIWLKSIFHKNDGYQTPIVLNPMRIEGDIDVNRLTYLSKQRLLSNIFQKVEENTKIGDSLRNLVNNKIAHKITLTLDFRKFIVLDEKGLKKVNEKFVYKIDGKLIHLYYTEKYDDRFEQILKSFYSDFKPAERIKPLDILTKEYILKKVFTIVKKYPEYKAHRTKVFRAKKNEGNEKACFDYIAKKDYSHSTFKLRQAINFFVFNYYELHTETQKEFLLSNNNYTGIADIINKKIEEWKQKELELIRNEESHLNDSGIKYAMEEGDIKYNLINFLPPSFFEVDIEFLGIGKFNALSSGEKQIVYSISSVIYHLLNLKSVPFDVSDSQNGRTKYTTFNLIYDEIELYFHPEFQRKYIDLLLKALKTINVSGAKINILFLTHSPFILSDIPKQNVLFLSDGKPEEFEKKNTFGANIADLLLDSFFFNDANEHKFLIGDFAKNEINKTIKWLNSLKNKNDFSKINESEKTKHKRIIDLIDEPLIRTKLTEMYYEVFDKEYLLEKEKEYIKNRAIELGIIKE
jgi:predicted ATP-binding protein involved in virulence